MDEQTKEALAGLELLIKLSAARWEQVAAIAVENQRSIAAIRGFLEVRNHDDPAD